MALALLWKKPEIRSQEAIGQLKKRIDPSSRNRKGVGHSGTLDPFAEGLLCVGLGEGCKLLTAFVGLEKNYQVDLCLGLSSKELDWSGEKEFYPEADFSKLTPDFVEKFLQSKIGDFEQIPPHFSALHVEGRRSYEWARQGVKKELKKRPAAITRIRFVDCGPEDFEGHPVYRIRFEVQVSSGTYIRALARDWGRELTGFAGILRGLCRDEIGPWKGRAEQELRFLGLEDLDSFFDRLDLEAPQAQRLWENGLWKPSKGMKFNKKWVLAFSDSDPRRPLALLDSEARLKRVFRENPLAH